MIWFYNLFFPVIWLGFVLYWQVKANQAKETERLEGAPSRVVRSLIILAAIALMSMPHLPAPFLYHYFLRPGLVSFFAGATVTLAGLLFAIWAREQLGTNWSRSVTIKKDHELITSGPYALVRHPIYTGILAGLLGSTIAEGQIRSLIGMAMVSIVLWFKLRLEETWMKGQFGASYEAYSRRVAALVPFLL